MSEHPKDLEYEQLVRDQIDILDDVCSGLGIPEIFDNSDVTFDPFWIFTHYLKFTLNRPNDNSIALDFHLMPDGMRINIDSYQEACEFSKQDIKGKRLEVKNTLIKLMSAHILVEYKGNAQFVNIFNDDGSRFAIWSLGSFSALLIHGYWNSQNIRQNLFSPIYPKRSN